MFLLHMKLGDKLKKHIAQWFIFTIVFALIPLFIFLVFSFALENSISNILNKCFHELFFYSIMVSATTINDLLHTKNDIKDSSKFVIAFGFIILLMLSSTSIYGVTIFADDFIKTSVLALHIDTLFVCSILFSLFTTIISYLVVNWRYQP